MLRDLRISEIVEQLTAAFDNLQPRQPYQLLLPDLRVSDCWITPVGNDMVLNVDVTNSGLAKASPFWVEVTVEIHPPPPQPSLPGQPPLTNFGPFRERCDGLPPGGVKRFRPFPMNVGNPGDGHFVTACVVVDPSSSGSPGGEIWESDEMNNRRCCGVFTTLQEPEKPPEIPDREIPTRRPSTQEQR